MPTRFGADGGFASTTSGGVFDSSGNPIISADNEFGGVPLGPAALAQTLFSVPNGTFNILPLDIEQPISNENPLPYWSSPVDNSDGEMIAQVVYDTTSNTYSLRMDPGSALSGDTLSITTRSAVISDDNLSLRQKAIATLEKVGTYAGTTQVNLKLDATYYDHTGTQLSTQAIGTVFDNGTFSSITGFTTAGTAAVGISAAYVDLTFTMTATANVTSGIAFDIDTILLQTSQGAGGGQSFLVTDTFTSSGTWTRPTGVDYLVAVVGLGAGGGGQRGALTSRTSSLGTAEGGAGGGGGAYAIVRDLYVGGVASISVGIGAAGIGGTAHTFSKPRSPDAGSANTYNENASGGGDGGATTFGTFLTIGGGQGSGRNAGTASSTVFDWATSTAGLGAANTSGSSGSVGNVGGSAAMAAFSQLSYLREGTAAGAAGSAGSVSITGAGSVIGASSGAAGGAAGYGGGGGGGGKSTQNITYVGGAGGAKGSGGGGGAASFQPLTTGGTAVVKGGDGGNAAPYSGAGGGGGGGATAYGSSAPYGATQITISSGKGGDGSSGIIYVIYVA